MEYKKILFCTGIAAGMISLHGISACNPKKADAKESSTTMISREDTIKHGEYLVTVIGCNDCHSPKTMGPKGPEIIPDKMLGGFPGDAPIPKAGDAAKSPWILFTPDLTATIGPWGMSFAANISSDPTGIGSWTEEQFFTALRQGKYKGLPGNRDLLPPMPWQSFRHLSDGDIRSIFAYLKSTRPVKNVVPAAILPKDL